jgi:hypothetical protein
VTRHLRQRFGQVVSGQDPDFGHWLARVDEA